MPTTVTHSIGTSSRDYSTLQAWEDACPSNLVTDDKIWRGECYADSTFTGQLVISGITTDATRYVELTTGAGQRHAGYWDTSKVLITGTDVAIITVGVSFAHIEGLQLQVSGTGSGSVATCIDIVIGSSDETRVGYCLMKGVSDGSGTGAALICTGVRGYTSGSGVMAAKIYNCVVFDFYNPTYAVYGVGFSNVFASFLLFNCTAYNCATGFYSNPSFQAKVINCLGGNRDVDFSGTFLSGSDYNASKDASAPGAHSLVSQSSGNIAFVSTTSTNADFLNIGSGSTCKDSGTNDPASGLYSDDIAGVVRSSWDIGAREYTGAGGGGFQAAWARNANVTI